MTPVISFVIPCYNSALFISPLLISLFSQKTEETPCEAIFVIDERNTDDTADKIKQFYDLFKPKNLSYSILSDATHSAGGARNVGIKAATGKYIWCLDSDDWLIHPSAAYFVSEAFKKDASISVVVVGFACVNPGFNPLIAVWSKIIERNLLLRHLFPDHSTQEDKQQATDLFNDPQAQRYVQIRTPLYYYNWPREGSLTGGKLLS